MFRKISYVLSILLVIAFPFYLWFYGWSYPDSTAGYLAAIGATRIFIKPVGQLQTVDWIMVFAPVGIGAVVLLSGSKAGLYYPIVINLGFFFIFYSSLSKPKNLIQKMAEKIEGTPLDSSGEQYTRIVTIIWCCFFVFNICVSVFLIWQDMREMWMLYNGLVSYVLIAVLLLGERLIRPRFRNVVSKS